MTPDDDLCRVTPEAMREVLTRRGWRRMLPPAYPATATLNGLAAEWWGHGAGLSQPVAVERGPDYAPGRSLWWAPSVWRWACWTARRGEAPAGVVAEALALERAGVAE